MSLLLRLAMDTKVHCRGGKKAQLCKSKESCTGLCVAMVMILYWYVYVCITASHVTNLLIQ